MASGFKLDWLGASVAGLVEEPGKLLVLAFIFNNRRYRSILNGLLLGAAVGAGFVASQSAARAGTAAAGTAQLTSPPGVAA